MSGVEEGQIKYRHDVMRPHVTVDTTHVVVKRLGLLVVLDLPSTVDYIAAPPTKTWQLSTLWPSKIPSEEAHTCIRQHCHYPDYFEFSLTSTSTSSTADQHMDLNDLFLRVRPASETLGSQRDSFLLETRWCGD